MRGLHRKSTIAIIQPFSSGFLKHSSSHNCERAKYCFLFSDGPSYFLWPLTRHAVYFMTIWQKWMCPDVWRRVAKMDHERIRGLEIFFDGHIKAFLKCLFFRYVGIKTHAMASRRPAIKTRISTKCDRSRFFCFAKAKTLFAR